MKYNTLTTERILSIDVFRGITILVMIFVNDVAGVGGIPQWMKHMPADADAMTFVDVVFPAFLFIVGMSLPFAINNRLAKGDFFWQLQQHIVWRTVGLLVLGVFMVNGEGGYNEEAMGMSIHVWSLLFYGSAILVWNNYPFRQKSLTWALKGAGMVGLIILGFLYRGGEAGEHGLTTQWWGILGLIGWAYLIACVIYQLVGGSRFGLMVAITMCVLWYILGRLPALQAYGIFQWMGAQAGHMSHVSIVLSGIVLSLIFFERKGIRTNTQRFMQAIVLTVIAATAAWLLRPMHGISKIYATPPWCLFCVAICCILFSLLYWFTDVKKISGWTAFLKPAAANPLLIYILPAILYHIQSVLGWYFMPHAFHHGWLGVAWSLCYAVIIMGIAILLNKAKIKLQL
ncbi:DUF5009 domain-containing protein [Paraflavitalea pollutisoli]|uniref:DUF5009 domain-containing protein n=1 Tax=Paraflavitalea pollutisoli TaxID=3034143 RepID=UPI0023EDAB5C|nr:DUF5009 domain-containing protein [Paraflavitalea sp. H1-2-19X]